jgi:tRNA pseudouridine32 synthase/23S rRNA pseudouridine746 synthase
MHCALAEGLGCPIRGDELYGHPADRLYLHADSIIFIHPTTGEEMTFTSPVPF